MPVRPVTTLAWARAMAVRHAGCARRCAVDWSSEHPGAGTGMTFFFQFDFPEIGPLLPEAAKLAIAKPARDEGVEVTADALDRIVTETHCYPYFVQEWGKHSWDTAAVSPITRQDADNASTATVAALDESFFRVRFDRLTPSEKIYLRAMAELGPGPHRSGDIAQQLRRGVTSLDPTRSQLITKGMIWSPQHGDTAFTVPLFDEFMRRIMPGDDWRT